MKTFKFSLVLRTRENTDVFITLWWQYLWYSQQKSKYPLCFPISQTMGYGISFRIDVYSVKSTYNLYNIKN